MAQEVQIAGTPAKAKIRSPFAPALLPYVTFFIYAWVWYYKINREMADLGRAKGTDELGDSPGKSLLAVTLGAIIIVPAVISTIRTFQRIQAAQRLSGLPQQANGWLALIMAILITPVFYAYEQSELNRAWRAGSGEAAAGAALPPVAEPAPSGAPAPAEPAS
jgi:hypothetical protein